MGILLFLSVLSALPVFVVAVTLASAQFDSDLQQHVMSEEFRTGFVKSLFDFFQLPLLYPAIVLLLSATVLREEIQNETIIYLWIKPLSRAAILISKYTMALLLAFVFSGLSLLITGVMLVNDWALIGNLLLAIALALLAYGAFFFTVSTILDRALLWGFAYVLGWEGLFSRISPAASQLSIRHYAENLERSLLGLPSEVSLETSLGVLLGLTVALLGIAVWRFSRMEFTGSESG
ncbi:MAG: hypothetical protein A2Z21_08655 [Candidatus Fraserbacteria bacterium RBG_16_55_9]|uniref:ABC transporter permease n=1 Tax=Fraserbacteria sp. (strain RBG_16_55_9) TaxID=1817864 RepID=A0A1F5UPH8_FRAXR|nr:MAG: hypothetical protein A2Z21_08655 [Candidatus Fraserbacteria bacterium RBG_16_55_9]